MVEFTAKERRGVAVRGVLSIFVLTLALGPAGAPLRAQEGQEDQDAREEQEGRDEEPRESQAVLDEIVVTAQKRTQNPQDIPISLSTIDT
jgi:hypothetical protein